MEKTTKPTEKRRAHFTRKNLIAIALVFFYVLAVIVSALGCDATNPVFKSKNPIQMMGLAFGFPSINGSVGSWLLVCCIAVYILLFAAAFIYEVRLARFYDHLVWNKKWSLVYLITFLISLLLSFGIGTIAQYPYDAAMIKNSYLFLAEALVVGLVIYLALFSVIGAILVLYVNGKNVDKPFRFFGREGDYEAEQEEEQQSKDNAEQEEQGKLAASFGEANASVSSSAAPSSGAGLASGAVDVDRTSSPLKDKERVFPGLCSLDYTEAAFHDGAFEEDITLKGFCERLRNHLAKAEKLYYTEATIRSFVAALASSRLIILEGLSGTGKSSLGRYFSSFIGEEPYFEAVQASWRDRTSLLGYYNDFSKTYNETEFLKRLYEYSYRPNHLNVMVLDEMNISRVEYYFADFLSIMEYPQDEWKLKIMQLPYDFEAPAHLPDGVLKIPANTWFIGTANKDDSTYTITDKVYDRAIAISFSDRNEPFTPTGDDSIAAISYPALISLFAKAEANKANNLSKEDLEKFEALSNFTRDTFDLTFGNRINTQIAAFVPVYVACGGSKEEALDFLFARKVVFKLEGHFEEYVQQGLIDLASLIAKTYGENSFPETRDLIKRLLRKF